MKKHCFLKNTFSCFNQVQLYARLCLAAALLITSSSSFAQAPTSYSASEIYLQLKKLQVLGSVLYIAAHPDDENTRLLTYFSKDRLYRTGYLSLTRGDGGQNLIGNEQGIELGLIRTQELLAARRIDGAEQFFSRAFDFGYSKKTEEALEFWEKEKILSDVVWVIRKFQPDVIITRFPEDERAGHGQHSGSAVLAREAFLAAGDETSFTEHFKFGVKPWSPRRIMWNTYNFGSNNTTSEDQLKIDAGGFNAILGKSYGELAAESRSQHKSQGFGVAASRGTQFEYFAHSAGDAAKSDVMEGIDLNWSRVKGAGEISKQIDAIIERYSLTNPHLSVPALVSLHDKLSALPEGYWKTQKMKEVQQLIESCSGLWMEGFSNAAFAISGDSIKITAVANNRSGANIKLEQIIIDSQKTGSGTLLKENVNHVESKSVLVTKPVFQPYWLQQNMSAGSYNIDQQELIGRPENAPSYTVKFIVTIENRRFEFVKPVLYKYTDPVKGELYQPLVVVPPVTISTEPDIVVFRKNEKASADVMVRLHAHKNFDGYTASVSKRLLNDNSTKIDTSFSLPKGASRNYFFTISNTSLKNVETEQTRAMVQLKNGKEQDSMRLHLNSINYDHIPDIHYFSEDVVRVLNIDVKAVGKKIGYVEGAGDKVPIGLQQLGYQVTVLKERDITDANLKQFDAVITGVRAYNVHPFLGQRYEILMNYVRNGGNLIVQYNTNSQFSPLNSRIGPYPFTISRTRVSDEKSPVQFAIPDHPVLNYPNKITSKDFEGWIQERGIYFAEKPGAKYVAPLLMNDPGEQPQSGSLIIGNYGKGVFVYTGLVFFRELPAGVPGAYRLLANIIALNKKKGF